MSQVCLKMNAVNFAAVFISRFLSLSLSLSAQMGILKCIREYFIIGGKFSTSNSVDNAAIGRTKTNHVPVEWKSSCTHNVRREVTIH